MNKKEYLTLPDGQRVEMEYALRCCCTIDMIKAILQDSMIDDRECFWKIEEIVEVFENMGLDAGGRHDF